MSKMTEATAPATIPPIGTEVPEVTSTDEVTTPVNDPAVVPGVQIPEGVTVQDWADATAVNPLAKWVDNMVLITSYRDGGEIQVNSTDWIEPAKRYFDKVKEKMDSRGGPGKMYLRAKVTRTDKGRYILA